jgi:GNAT superfamily N-acetyltransferase
MSARATGVAVRRIRPDDWERVRSLRLEALRDPVAHLAFLETVEQATARADQEWIDRASTMSAGDSGAQFLAERSGEVVGSLAVIIRRAGVPDYFDRIPETDLPTVVGVYVGPSARGLGVIDALLTAAADWSRARGDVVLTLDVHEANTPAIRSYERNGFELASVFEAESWRELSMVKQLVDER